MLLAAASGAILLVTVPVGLFSTVALDRAVSLGFYVVGSFLVVLGFLGGSRGPFRTDHDVTAESALRAGRRLRRATRNELFDSINTAAIMIGIGIVLVALGVVIDSRFALL